MRRVHPRTTFLEAIVWIAMGWLRLVGSLKSWVSFAKEPCKTDDILQKRLIILRSLLFVATPYSVMTAAFPSSWSECYSGLIHSCAITHSCVCHDSFVRVGWLGGKRCDVTFPYLSRHSLCVCPDSFVCLILLECRQ